LFWKNDQLFQLPVSYWNELGWINSPGYRTVSPTLIGRLFRAVWSATQRTSIQSRHLAIVTKELAL
jgi:hypothetical protein